MNTKDIARYLVYELPVEEEFDTWQLTNVVYKNIAEHFKPLPMVVDAESVNEAIDRLGLSGMLLASDVPEDDTIVHICLVNAPIVH
jgi:hypothetical protein